VATAQNGRRDMPLVWGVYPWKDMVLASDINSGLWVFRVTAANGGNGSGSGPGGAGPGAGQQAAPPPQAAPDPATNRAGDRGGLGAAGWVALAGLALGLLAAGAVARSAARRRRPG
jgi:hypothetical protein